MEFHREGEIMTVTLDENGNAVETGTVTDEVASAASKKAALIDSVNHFSPSFRKCKVRIGS